MVTIIAHVSFTQGTTVHPRQIPAFTLDTSNQDPHVLLRLARDIVDPFHMCDVEIAVHHGKGITLKQFEASPDW